MSDEMNQASPEGEAIAEDQQIETTQEQPQAEPEQQQEQPGEEAKSQQNRDEKGRFKPVQPRIDELTRQRHEAEREAAYWRERAMANTQDKAQPSANEPPAKPTPDKFNDYAEYVEALADWKADQKVREALSARDADQAKQAEARVQQTKQQAFAERVQQVKTAYADYDEVVGLSDIPVAPHVAEVMLDSEQGPALAYHLAKNPDIATRLNSLPPIAAARELGRIEAALQKPAPVAKTVSKAPEPIKPIGSGRTNAGSDLSKMDMDQYMAMRAKQGARWAK